MPLSLSVAHVQVGKFGRDPTEEEEAYARKYSAKELKKKLQMLSRVSNIFIEVGINMKVALSFDIQIE